MFARRGLLALLLSGLPLAFGRQVTSLATSDVVSTSMRNDVQVVTLQTVLHMGLTSRIMSTETAAGRIYTETLMSTFINNIGIFGVPLVQPYAYSTRISTSQTLIYHWTEYDVLSTQQILSSRTKQVPVVTTLHVPFQTVFTVPDEPTPTTQTTAATQTTPSTAASAAPTSAPSSAAPSTSGFNPSPSSASVPAAQDTGGSSALPDGFTAGADSLIAISAPSGPASGGVLTVYSTRRVPVRSNAPPLPSLSALRLTLTTLGVSLTLSWLATFLL